MSESGAEIDNLYPALTQCFVIISCGYLAGRMNLISETEAKGINTFVGTFALPSLIFMSLAELDLTSVNWLFLLSVLISKGILFFAVILVTLLISRPFHFGRAGIFAIFCTQSNDFAIGYPIVVALYKSSHPEYASYLYLMAPISLAILNPIGFVLMEVHKRRTYGELSPVSINSESNGETSLLSNENRKKFKLTVSVMKSIFFNPIILMTLLGIVGNLIFKHNVPVYLSEILKALGSAFSASALFLLGLRMVGKVHKLRGATLVVPGILIICKLLVLPIVTRQVINIFKPGINDTETTDLSTYGFLYGTFPAAPTVFVFATQYAIDIDLIASAMVACTFISAPLMFVSAKMISLPSDGSQDYVKQLESFMFDVSILGVICSIWVLLVFTLTKKITKVPHKITGCLVLAQLTSCLGAILWKTIDDKTSAIWIQYLQFTVFSVGVYSSRLWTAILAMILLFLQCRSLCFVIKLLPWCYFIGFGFPIALSGLLLAYDKSSLPFEQHNPNFAYGIYQAIVAVSLLVFCFISTVGCLILHQRYRRRHERYLSLANDVAETFDSNRELCEAGSSNSCPGRSPVDGGAIAVSGCCGGSAENTPIVVDIEDIDKKFKPKVNSNQNPKNIYPKNEMTNTNNLNSQRKRNDSVSCAATGLGCGGGNGQNECQDILRRYQEPIDEDIEVIEEEPDTHDAQILRHVVLLILLLCSMFVGLSLCIWTLIMDRISGIYIELSFLDTTLNFGQSIIVFAVFGTDTKDIVLPLLKYWRKLWYGANTLVLPAWDELGADTKHICDQFVTHHLSRCRDDIAEDKRWRLKVYRKVFAGARLVDWLLEYGLARDRVEAVHYARHLVEGKVLRHINGVYHFYDRNLLYTFN